MGIVTDNSTPALRFTLNAAVLHGMVITNACVGSRAIRTTVPVAASATLTSTTFDAVAIDFTFSGTAYSFSAAVPPDPSFSIADGSVSLVAIEGPSMHASQLTLHSPVTALVAC